MTVEKPLASTIEIMDELIERTGRAKLFLTLILSQLRKEFLCTDEILKIWDYHYLHLLEISTRQIKELLIRNANAGNDSLRPALSDLLIYCSGFGGSLFRARVWLRGREPNAASLSRLHKPVREIMSTLADQEKESLRAHLENEESLITNQRSEAKDLFHNRTKGNDSAKRQAVAGCLLRANFEIDSALDQIDQFLQILWNLKPTNNVSSQDPTDSTLWTQVNIGCDQLDLIKSSDTILGFLENSVRHKPTSDDDFAIKEMKNEFNEISRSVAKNLGHSLREDQPPVALNLSDFSGTDQWDAFLCEATRFLTAITYFTMTVAPASWTNRKHRHLLDVYSSVVESLSTNFFAREAAQSRLDLLTRLDPKGFSSFAQTQSEELKSEPTAATAGV